MPRYKKPMRTKQMQIDLSNFLSCRKGRLNKHEFIKKYGMSPGYCRSMYKPYKPKKLKKAKK